MKSFMKSLKEGASKSSSKSAGKSGKKAAKGQEDPAPGPAAKKEPVAAAAVVAAADPAAAAADPSANTAAVVAVATTAAPTADSGDPIASGNSSSSTVPSCTTASSSSSQHSPPHPSPHPSDSIPPHPDPTAADPSATTGNLLTEQRDSRANSDEAVTGSQSSGSTSSGNKEEEEGMRSESEGPVATPAARPSDQQPADPVPDAVSVGPASIMCSEKKETNQEEEDQQEPAVDQKQQHVLHQESGVESDAPANVNPANNMSSKSEGGSEKESVDVTSYSRELERHGLQLAVSRRLCHLFSCGKLSSRDLDDRAIDAVKEYGNLDAVLQILDEFENSNLEHVNNKSAFLCGLMKTHRQKEKALKQKGLSIDSNNSGKDHHSGIVNGFVTMSSAAAGIGGGAGGAGGDGAAVPSSGVTPGPDEANLKAILQRTGYTLDVTSGQRKYGGPPPDWTDPPPGPGCEIFVGKIPKELFEEELIPIFEEVGRIWDLRLMIDPVNGYNRGFAFITYCTKDEATSAQLRFDGYEIRKGKPLKVNVSVPNLRLFVGNIPKSKSKSEIFNEFNKLTGGLHEVIVYSSPDDRKKNRGFCFLEYESHKSASLAKRKLSTGRNKVWGCDILVDWADPQEEPDQATMERVKVLYVRNLVADVTEDELKEVFSVYGQIERVKKIKDYAFIHFEDRDHAVRAMRSLQDSELRGVRISVSLAKPPSDRKKKEEILRNRERRVTLMMQQRSLVPGMGIPGPMPNLPPLSAHMPPVPLSLQNGSLRSAKSARGQSYQMQGLPPVSPYRPVPPYHPASAWAQLPEWLPYAGYPANWNWAYSTDPRSGALAAAAAAAAAAGGPAAAHYARSMAMPPHHPGAGMSVGASLNANSRNHRSLWTPNGPGNNNNNSSMNSTPAPSSDSKPKNWNRRNRNNNNNDNNGSGHKSGFGEGRV